MNAFPSYSVTFEQRKVLGSGITYSSSMILGQILKLLLFECLTLNLDPDKNLTTILLPICCALVGEAEGAPGGFIRRTKLELLDHMRQF